MHTVRVPYHELELSHVPERRGVVQAGKNIPYAGSCVAVLEPTQFNGPPQFITESELFSPLRFVRSDSLHNFVDDEDIRLELEVGAVSA